MLWHRIELRERSMMVMLAFFMSAPLLAAMMPVLSGLQQYER
jgi:hypothetical protein